MQLLIRRQNQGFTLIEIIMTILILAILGAMGSELISSFFRGFSASDARMELFGEGKSALMRLERDLHNMVPNGIDITSSTDIHFGTIAENSLAAKGLSGRFTFPDPALTAQIQDEVSSAALDQNSLISIYNTSWPDLTAPASATSRRVYQVSGLTGTTMILHKGVIATPASQRYYPLATAVRYYLNGTTLLRAQTSITHNTDFITTLDGIQGYPMLTGVSNLVFNYTPASLTSNGLITVAFTLSKSGATINFHKEIHVRNVP